MLLYDLQIGDTFVRRSTIYCANKIRYAVYDIKKGQKTAWVVPILADNKFGNLIDMPTSEKVALVQHNRYKRIIL